MSLVSGVSVVSSVLVLFVSLAAQVEAVTCNPPRWSDKSLQPDTDCNHNGIGDRRDRELGILEDRDRNGIDDWCSADSSFLAFQKRGWESLSETTDSAYVGVEYVFDRGILLKCTVPKGKRGVRIRAIDANSSSVWECENDPERQGFYTVLWMPRHDYGRPLQTGRAFVEFLIAGRSYWRSVAWHWKAPPVWSSAFTRSVD